VRRVVAQRHLDQGAVGGVADRRGQAVGGRLPPELAGLQIDQAGGRRTGAQPLGGPPAERDDPVGRWGRVQLDAQVTGQAGERHAVPHGDPLHARVRSQIETADDQMDAAGHAGAHDAIQLDPMPGGQFADAGQVGEQHHHPPGRRAGSGGVPGQLGQRRILAGQHALVDPADVLHHVVEHRPEPARPDQRQTDRREGRERPAQVRRVVDGELDLARPGAAERSQQQPGDHPVHGGLPPAQVDVGGVQQRHEPGHGVRLEGDGPDPEQPRLPAAFRLGG
jgi:hypothetical protein